jgi:hypothetical protein
MIADHERVRELFLAVPTTGVQSPQLDIGTVLAGRYFLLEEIGEGGMGTVWMARQNEPVKRIVAVKLIKPGMNSKLVLARFEAERQALARARAGDAVGTAAVEYDAGHAGVIDLRNGTESRAGLDALGAGSSLLAIHREVVGAAAPAPAVLPCVSSPTQPFQIVVIYSLFGPLVTASVRVSPELAKNQSRPAPPVILSLARSLWTVVVLRT